MGAPGREAGSLWTQVLVFPAGKRYLLSMNRKDAVNAGDALFLRVDLPGHIKDRRAGHREGNGDRRAAGGREPGPSTSLGTNGNSRSGCAIRWPLPP